jgi:ppGpp synthetase/RelA/SpoT-type nucleotidyltranferase
LDESACNQFIKTHSLTEIRKLFDQAYKKLINSKKDVVVKWRQNIVSVLGDLKNGNEEEQLRRVFNMIVSYQYYDNPYRIYFFLPDISNDTTKPLPKKNDDLFLQSALVITTSINGTNASKYYVIFQTLSQTLYKITVIEQQIFNKFTDHLPIYWQWKDHYQDWHEKYEILSEMAINICRAIDHKNKNLKILYTPHRVKDFDSFYTKIIDELNNSSSRQIQNKNKVKEALLRGTDIDSVFNALKDIAGARAVCLYSEDVKIIQKELDSLHEDGQINRIDLRNDKKKTDDPKNKGYRAVHYWFTIGDKRKDLYEYTDLENLKC